MNSNRQRGLAGPPSTLSEDAALSYGRSLSALMSVVLSDGTRIKLALDGPTGHRADSISNVAGGTTSMRRSTRPSLCTVSALPSKPPAQRAHTSLCGAMSERLGDFDSLLRDGTPGYNFNGAFPRSVTYSTPELQSPIPVYFVSAGRPYSADLDMDLCRSATWPLVIPPPAPAGRDRISIRHNASAPPRFPQRGSVVGKPMCGSGYRAAATPARLFDQVRLLMTHRRRRAVCLMATEPTANGRPIDPRLAPHGPHTINHTERTASRLGVRVARFRSWRDLAAGATRPTSSSRRELRFRAGSRPGGPTLTASRAGYNYTCLDAG